MTAPPAPSYGFEWGDKINHAGAYFLLMLLAWRAVRWLAPGRSNRWHLLAALAFVAFYGATDELHQAFVPGRDCDLFDWLADVTGGVPGLLSIQARGRLAFARAKEREG
jgi:VanZ family protein